MTNETSNIEIIRQMDANLAPGSETAMLGDAIESLTSDDSKDNFAWWCKAYGLYEILAASGEDFDIEQDIYGTI